MKQITGKDDEQRRYALYRMVRTVAKWTVVFWIASIISLICGGAPNKNIIECVICVLGYTTFGFAAGLAADVDAENKHEKIKYMLFLNSAAAMAFPWYPLLTDPVIPPLAFACAAASSALLVCAISKSSVVGKKSCIFTIAALIMTLFMMVKSFVLLPK